MLRLRLTLLWKTHKSVCVLYVVVVYKECVICGTCRSMKYKRILHNGLLCGRGFEKAILCCLIAATNSNLNTSLREQWIRLNDEWKLKFQLASRRDCVFVCVFV